MKKQLNLLTATVLTAAMASVATPADAGRGSSYSRIVNAITSDSQERIIAELEKAENLICAACFEPVMDLLDDPRYEVREVAAWWFARRPALKSMLTNRSIQDLTSSDSITVRNAADVLGTFRHPQAIPALAAASLRNDITAEARAHAVFALGTIGHGSANPTLSAAMSDASGDVRLNAVTAWHQIRWQDGAAPVVGLIGDSDARVRRKATAVVGNLREVTARTALESQLANDSDPVVRRNAAWALGRIGDRASQSVLQAAADDASPLVRATARVALRQLR